RRPSECSGRRHRGRRLARRERWRPPRLPPRGFLYRNPARQSRADGRQSRASFGLVAVDLTGQNVARRAGHVCVDVVDQLIRQRLYGLGARPRYMRREDEIRQVEEFHQRMVRRGRFRYGDVQPGAAQLTATQGRCQRVVVDQGAARRVDQQRLAGHFREFFSAQQVMRMRVQRAMQGDDIAFGKHRVEGCVQCAHVATALVGCKQHAHAQCSADLRNRLSQGSCAYDAQGRACEVADGIVEVAELGGLLPASGLNRFPVSGDAAAQGEDQGEYMLRYAAHGVTADVRHDDASFLACRKIYVVATCRGQRNHFQLFRSGNILRGHLDLIHDHDIRVCDTRGHFFRLGSAVKLQGVREVRRPQHGLGGDGVSIQEYDFQGRGCHVSPLLGHFRIALDCHVAALPIRYSNGFVSVVHLHGGPFVANGESMTDESLPPIYPLTDFFRNPERGFYRLSDDGTLLAYMEPVAFGDGPPRRNLFVQPLEGSQPVGEARCLTRETDRDIAEYYWKGSDILLYAKDFEGDENFHVVAVDVNSAAVSDLTPYPDTRAG